MSDLRCRQPSICAARGLRDRVTGSILIEILIAVVLLCIAVAPLGTAMDAAKERVALARSQNQRAVFAATVAWTREAWVWGSQIMSAEWRPGPALDLLVGLDAGSETVVGLWIDGWFAGEQRPEADGRLVVKGPTFIDHVGHEVVVRVRLSGGYWGPPWRSLVPDFTGQVARGPLFRRDVCAGEPDRGGPVLHTPVEAKPAFEVSDPGLAVQADAAGFPVFLGGVTADECVIRLGKAEQAWRVEAGRVPDLYF